MRWRPCRRPSSPGRCKNNLRNADTRWAAAVTAANSRELHLRKPFPIALDGVVQNAFSNFVYPREIGAKLDASTSNPPNRTIDDGFTLVRAANRIDSKAVEITALLRSLTEPTLPTPFPATGLGNQLQQVAKLISLRNAVGIKRQIFFCSLGGFDTHNGQVNGADSTQGTHAGLLAQLSAAMKAFHDATAALGVDGQVTSFTMSDFSRTGKANGGVGSDHAWGTCRTLV